MALTPTGAIIHLPFSERPGYGSPYPEGMAVGFIAQTGDGSGGTILFTFNADSGFLYRLELVNVARGSASIISMNAVTSHRWAEDKSGLGTSAFDLNWILGGHAGGTAFAVYTLNAGEALSVFDVIPQIRRFPIGRVDNVPLQAIIAITADTNSNAVTHEVAVVFTYWRKEAMYRPGFLSSFHEAPVVPLVGDPGR